jgi:hypothetical protein
VLSHTRSTVPSDIRQAEPSLFRDPSGPTEILLVSGPRDLVKMVISNGGVSTSGPGPRSRDEGAA